MFVVPTKHLMEEEEMIRTTTLLIVKMSVNEKTVTKRAKLGEIWLNQLVQSPNFKVYLWFPLPQLLWSGLTKLG